MIPAIVLAAGRLDADGASQSQFAASEDGETFLSRIVETFRRAGIEDVVVVVGHEADSDRRGVRADGRGRAVRDQSRLRARRPVLVAARGLNAIDRPGVMAALVTLVDVPLVSVETVRAVVDRYRQTHAPVVRPVRGEEHGHPVLIDRTLFDLIRRADPKVGAKPVLRAHASAEGDVEVADDGAFLDIDTKEDYLRIVGLLHPFIPPR